MAYTKKDWLKRIQNRNDITSYLTHFTRKAGRKSAFDALIQIIEDRKINGSNTNSGFIVGENSAVCFQDAPSYSLFQNLYFEFGTQSKVRYEGFGLAFQKRKLYQQGARPVIYDQTDAAKKYLSVEEHWRIVNFDLNGTKNIIDWTHEREWRIKGSLKFKLNDVTVYLQNKTYYQSFIKIMDKETLESLGGIIILNPVFN